MRNWIQFLYLWILILLICSRSVAQGYMVTLSTTVPNHITLCGPAQQFTVQIYNPSPNLLTGIVLTVTMPAGMRYTAGSITGASELNISNLSAPQFALADMTTLTTRNISFTASAGCDLMNYLASGNVAQNHLRIDYLANGYPFYDAHTTFTYVVRQPNLSINTVTNQSYSGNVGDNFQRCITITNGGLGELSSFILTDEHGNGITINSVNRGTRITQGNTEIITLSGTDFTSIGNGNNLFESGESITICENVTVNNCVSVQSQFTVGWGCNNQVCQYAVSNANVVFPNLTPDLVVTHQPAQSACYGLNQPNQQQLTITNNGQGKATNVVINIFQSTGSTFSGSMSSFIDANSFTYQIGAGPLVSIAATVTGNNTGFGCLGGVRPGRVAVNLPEINAGETLYLRWNTYSCCHDYCGGSSPHAGTNNGWSYDGTYRNVCQHQYVIPITYARGYSQLYADLTNNGSPATIVSGQTLTYRFLFSNDINTYVSTAGRQWRFVVTMPNCVTYAGNARIVALDGVTTWNATSATVSGNILTITFTGNQPFNRLNGDLRFDLRADCSGGCTGGQGALLIESYFVSDPMCACVHRLSCYSFPLNVVCPVQCVGLNMTGFSMSRTSYGLRDDNNDGVPEPGSVNPGLIRTDRTMFGDTITAIFSGNVAGGSFSYLYAQSSITNGNDYLAFLDGILTITRGTTVYTCNVAAPSVNNTGSTRTFRFDLSASVLVASGCVPGGFTFQNGDVVEFRPRYRIYRNPGGAILTCDVTNEFYNSHIPNPSNATDKLWCNNYTAAFSIIGYYYTNWGPNSVAVSSCNQVTISQNYYLSIGPCCQQYAGGNLFPFEYRRWAWPKNLIVTPPAGYRFVSARFNHVRTSGNGSISSTAWQSVTPVNSNGPVFDFYVEPYFSQFGGPFQESDDGFYGTLEVTLMPTCEVTQNVATAVAYDWYFGESPILQGSNTTNRVFVNTQDYITYQGPDLFVQSLLPTVLAQDRSVSWDVSLSNTTNVVAHHVFIAAPVISGVTVTEVFDVTNNVVITPATGGIYQLGQIAANSTRNIRITASYTSCVTDSIIIHAGWNCMSYPVDLASYPCVTDQIKLRLTPQIPTLIANITSPSGTVDLCDTATYTVEGINIQLGTAYDLKLRVILPAGVSIVSGSTFMSYPPGSPFVPIPAPTFISGTTYEWDLSSISPTLGTDGLKGILQNTLNTVKVRFRVRTDCMYTSGSLIGFVFHGRSACGLYTGQEVTLSTQLAITGATKPYETRVDLISTYISPCANNTLMTVNVVNNGPLPTGPADSVIIVMPQGVRFVNGSYTGIHNAPLNNTFVSYMLNNRQHIQWKLPQHIVAGDSVRFSFRFEANASSLDCNIQNFEAYTVSNKNLLCVLNGQQCGINVRTGDTILPMYVYKAYLNITTLEASAVQNAPAGETLNIDMDILNVGENIAAGNNIIIDFYRDADGNGQLSPVDILVGRDTITGAINTNATVSNNTILNVPAGFGCNLIAVLNPINNGCICNMTQRFTGNIPLLNAGNDKSACSGATIQIGTPGVNGYQYLWTPSAGLSNPNNNITDFSMQNQSGNNLILNYRLETNRIYCTSSDTLQITVFPETNVSFSGLSTTYCSNDAPSILTGSPFGGFFSGTGVSANIFNPSAAGYGVKNIIYSYTDINNCTWRDTQQTTILSAPQATISGVMTDYCIDAPDVVMTALPGGGIFTGNGISGNIFSPSAAGAGQHMITYTYTDVNQCSDTALHPVTVRPLPSVSFSGLSTQYCENDTAAILIPQPSGGVFYGTGINNGNQFDPGLSGPGNFRIIYTYRDVYQCQNSDTQWVVVHPVVPAVFTGLQPQYCLDAPTTPLTGTPSGGVFSGNGISGNNFSPSVAGAGNHLIYYIFTDANNCISIDSQVVRINDLPQVHFTGLASAYCIDDAITQLHGNQPAGIFSGNGIAGTRFIPAAAGIGTHTIIYSYTDANGCFNADTQLTVVHGLPVVTFSGLEPGYCADDPAVYLTGTPPGGIFSGNGISANYFTPSDAGSGRHIITYFYTDTSNCSNFSTQEVEVYPAPVVNADIRSISCYGEDDGSIVLQIIDGTAPFDIRWNNGIYSGPHLVSLSQGNYELMLTDANGCTFSDIYNISEPQLLASSFEKTDVTCHGDADGMAVFTVNGGTPPYSFSWNNGIVAAEYYSLSPGIYSVTISDAHGCQNIHTFSITQPDPIWVRTIPAIDSVFRGNSIQITTDYFANDLFVTYQWTPTDGLSCSRCAQPTATPDVTTQYTVSITDETGCEASASVWIVVKDEHVYYAPNIFSPNGDGINDVFQIFVKGTREFHLQIHDRWGELVFRSDNPNAAWNGTLNGTELPDGVYVYDVYVVYQDGVVYKKKGSITLVR